MAPFVLPINHSLRDLFSLPSTPPTVREHVLLDLRPLWEAWLTFK